MTISAFGLTDVGRKRRHNEDAYLLDAERGLFVVADGMGGHAAGEVASRITVESIQEFIAGTEEEHENTWPFGFNNRFSLEGNRLTTAVEKANEKVMRAVQNRPELKGMGTTVVAALFDQDRATLVHVGDSRAYLLRGGELRRLTDDHSWVQEQVNAGILSEDEAKTHPLKNVVTRALGGAAHVAVDLIEVPISHGDRFLLCSDGLTGMVTDDEIIDRLRSRDPIDRIVRGLVEFANERGGIDNVTAILVEVGRDGQISKATDQTVPDTADSAGESTAIAFVGNPSAEKTDISRRPLFDIPGPVPTIPVDVTEMKAGSAEGGDEKIDSVESGEILIASTEGAATPDAGLDSTDVVDLAEVKAAATGEIVLPVAAPAEPPAASPQGLEQKAPETHSTADSPPAKLPAEGE